MQLLIMSAIYKKDMFVTLLSLVSENETFLV